MIAPFAGGRGLTSTRSRGARLYSYHHPNRPDTGLCWMRLGSTVVVRLDAPDPAPLEQVLIRVEQHRKGGTPTGTQSEAPPLSEEEDFSKLALRHSAAPGLWGFVRGPGVLQWIEQAYPATLTRAIDATWMPSFKEALERFRRTSLWTELSPDGGLAVALEWSEDGTTGSNRRTEENDKATTDDLGGTIRRLLDNDQTGRGNTPLISLWTQTRRIPELTNWIVLITRSVSQTMDLEEEQVSLPPAPAQEKAAGYLPTESERAEQKKERRWQKKRLQAVLRELANPAVTSRLLSALGDWAVLDIRNAGLSSEGRWRPDWDFVAKVADEERLRAAASEFFRSVQERETQAALRPWDALTTGAFRTSGSSEPRDEGFSGPNDLLRFADWVGMDLRPGRLVVRIPGDGTLRLGVHRYRRPGEPSDVLGSPHGVPTVFPAGASAGDSETTLVLGLRVDWPQLAVHLEALVGPPGGQADPIAVRPGTRDFCDWAQALSWTGTARFLVVLRPKTCVWVFHLPLRP